VRVVFFLLTIMVIILAVARSVMSPSMEEEERACARKCESEGFSSHRFTPPGMSNPRAQFAPESCVCLR
jgi:hypothetical protein